MLRCGRQRCSIDEIGPDFGPLVSGLAQVVRAESKLPDTTRPDMPTGRSNWCPKKSPAP